MPMIATTIINSIRVKPRSADFIDFFRCPGGVTGTMKQPSCHLDESRNEPYYFRKINELQ
jgi:hypothetical protein